ncbi:MAG: MFS transporter [Rhodospirillaceae bacterium]|nr:MFS transporter [Rhodospirillaceae bacterium]
MTSATAEPPQTSTPKARASLLYGLIMLIVALASLWLLIYVGYAEGRRTYQNLVVDKMIAQAEIVQTPLNTYLRAGLPLEHFPGFAQIGRRVLSSDPSILSITVTDSSGKPIFREAREGVEDFGNLPLPPDGERMLAPDDPTTIRALLRLRDRFETVGAVVVATPRSAVDSVARRYFLLVVLVASGLAILFALGAVLFKRRLDGARFPWLYISFGAAFAAVAAAVVLNLVSLYTGGLQGRAQALAESLRQRVAPVVEFELDMKDLGGLRETFQQYRHLNSDIQAIGMMRGDQVQIHTDSAREGTTWQPRAETYEFASTIGATNLRIAVTLPTSVVWRAVAKNIRNFIALFLATVLFAGVLLRLGHVLSDNREAAKDAHGSTVSANATRAIEWLKLLFFLAVFFEHLPVSFLPQMLRDAAAAGGYGAAAASWAFTTYFLCFLIVLVPATKIADLHGPRALLWTGALLAGSGALLLALSDWFPALAAARGLSGLGQGALLIGTQTYIVTHAPRNMRTRAAAVIVFGFNGGMISGTAIGSLLVNYITAQGVFLLGAATAAVIAFAALTMMPRIAGAAASSVALNASFFQASRRVLTNLKFLRVICLIGLPSKAVLTGIVVFAMPLVLNGMGYPPEDIGQLIMIYPCGVLLASGWISRRVDNFGGALKALAAGALIAGGGMMTVGLTGWADTPSILTSGNLEPVIIGVGIFLLGLAHGLINAPIISYVASMPLAQEMGANQVTSLYRVLERAGHVAGPILAGQLLLMTGGGPISVGWAGIVAILLGILFLLTMLGRHWQVNTR